MIRIRPLYLAGCLFLFVFTTFLPLSSQQAVKCVALLTDVRGDVYVKPATIAEFKKATWGAQLNTGDVLKTSDAGSASILLSNKDLVELGPSSSVTISEGLAKSAAKSRSIQSMDTANPIDLSGLSLRSTTQGDVVALAGLRGGNSGVTILQVSPRNSKIRSIRPSFAWQATVSVEKFKIKVYGSNGLLWERETDSTQIQYPSDAPPLISGSEYFWQVEGLALVESFQSASIGFRVVNQKDRALIDERELHIRVFFADNPRATSYQFLVGTLYQQQGLFEESITAFESIAHLHPDAPVVYEVLGTLYNEIGLKDKAIAALQKALTLTQQQ